LLHASPSVEPVDKQTPANRIWLRGDALLQGLHVSHLNDQVLLNLNASIEPVQSAEDLASLIQTVKSAAGWLQSLTNLDAIGMAFIWCSEERRLFPIPAMVGPDGQTLHSWRVAILPYIGHKALYEQYRLNEPWDSAANIKVMEQMPAVFRSPNDARPGYSSSYYLLDGKPAIFNGTEKVSFREITDGASQTIQVVEARQDIPWTKPEDVTYDPNKPLPRLGGFQERVFNVMIADYSVLTLPNQVDEKVLRAMISRDGGEYVDFESLQLIYTRPANKP
jgi:hypothetical protein